jgi:23S rRNA pseudouridine1911/1915/1917 synthase
MPAQTISVRPDQANQTLAAVLRAVLPGHSWEQVRRLAKKGHVRVGGEVCLDSARRLREGEVMEILDRPAAGVKQRQAIVIRYLDSHLVVAEKPSGMNTVRHPAERAWPARRKALNPTLEDVLPMLIARQEKRPSKQRVPRLRVVHRLDKETSGLVVFARSVAAERGLGRQFHEHSVLRSYLAIVPGQLGALRIESRLVRDRGDKRRGSTTEPGQGKRAVTHVEVVERMPGYTLLACRLETGRTHQIRIHLAEAGHPVCGDKVYIRRRDRTVFADESNAPHLALHAAELGFVHPIMGKRMHWAMPWPTDMLAYLSRLRAGGGPA